MRFKVSFPYKSVVSPLLAVSANILLVFIIYTIARIEFLLENLESFSHCISEGRLLEIFFAGMRFDTPGIFYTNALYIFLMLLPFHFKEREGWYKMCKWVFIIVNGFALFINFADSVYFPYIMRRTSWGILNEFGNEMNFGKIVWVEMVRHWYLVVLAAILIWGMWKLYVSPAMDIKKQGLTRYYILSILSLVFASVVAVTGIRGGLFNHWYNYIIAFPLSYVSWRLLHQRKNSGAWWSGVACAVGVIVLLALAPVGGWRHRDIRPIAISNANAYTKHPTETALVLNTPFTVIRSIGNAPFSNPRYFADNVEMEKVYTPVHHSADSLPVNRKNLCIIIIESFGKEYIGAMNRDVLGEEYKGYTPFTDSLLTRSAWWRHSFDNGQKSIDGMPSILASIPSFVRPFVLTPQAVNHIKGIPALLGEMGYTSAFFHGARTGSMGFDGFARSIGFQNYYGREDFSKDSRFGGDKDFDGYWAIWDEPFMEWYAMKMTEMKQPFVTAIFTASNHHPFHIPEKYNGKFPGGTMKIHPTVGYTDKALKEFFAVAERQPWYDNTIFIITNDHTNMREHDEYKSDIGLFYGPVIIFDPSGNITPGEREGIAQQTDILPTMVNYMGYGKDYVAFGCDLFSTPVEQTWAVSYLNGVYQFVKGDRILQFDGTKEVALFDINDHRMQHNLLGKEDPSDMTRQLKAIIQQYMDRMLTDHLTIK